MLHTMYGQALRHAAEFFIEYFAIDLIMDGEGACPPEDCGGIPGYQRVRDVLAGPPSPDQNELLDWLGLDRPADFAPARFDHRDADTRLAALTWAAGRN